jgi:Mrp family chromosome partitioning ATPase
MSRQARSVIQRVAKLADYTIIDATPLAQVADGAEIAILADATLLVFRAGKTSWDQVARSMAFLEKVGRRPAGVVLNMVNKRSARGDSSYEYSAYRPHPTMATDSTAAGVTTDGLPGAT